jgi:hypothetical protein
MLILVMGISLAVVILLYIWIGHIGPSFSSDTLQRQQQALRMQYGLPYKPIVTDPKMLQTPPSEGAYQGTLQILNDFYFFCDAGLY